MKEIESDAEFLNFLDAKYKVIGSDLDIKKKSGYKKCKNVLIGLFDTDIQAAKARDLFVIENNLTDRYKLNGVCRG